MLTSGRNVVRFQSNTWRLVSGVLCGVNSLFRNVNSFILLVLYLLIYYLHKVQPSQRWWMRIMHIKRTDILHWLKDFLWNTHFHYKYNSPRWCSEWIGHISHNTVLLSIEYFHCIKAKENSISLWNVKDLLWLNTCRHRWFRRRRTLSLIATTSLWKHVSVRCYYSQTGKKTHTVYITSQEY